MPPPRKVSCPITHRFIFSFVISLMRQGIKLLCFPNWVLLARPLCRLLVTVVEIPKNQSHPRKSVWKQDLEGKSYKWGFHTATKAEVFILKGNIVDFL